MVGFMIHQEMEGQFPIPMDFSKLTTSFRNLEELKMTREDKSLSV
jgi:hypothetical protein